MTTIDEPETNGTAPTAKTPRRKRARAATESVAPPPEIIEIKPISSQLILVPVIGTSPLIISKFSDKAKLQMLATQQNETVVREPRDPHREFEAAMYRFAAQDQGGAGWGIPAVSFKEATVGSARYYKGISMKEVRQYLFFRGVWSSIERKYLVRILPQEDLWANDPPIDPETGEVTEFPRNREDVVRLAGANHSADLRYRPEFIAWRANLFVTYVQSCISRNSVVNMINAGGMGVGVGEWRPERRGESGTYRVPDDADIKVIA